MKKVQLLFTAILLLVNISIAQSLYPIYDGHNSSAKGYMNKMGELVVPYQYMRADDFSEGIAVVSLNGKYGYINEKGEEVTPLLYDKALPFKNGYALVKSGEFKYLIDKDQKRYEIDNLPRDYQVEVSEGLVKIKVNGHYGFVNLKNELVIPANYKKVSSYQNGVSVGVKKGQFGDEHFLISKSGKETPFKVKAAREFSGGLMAVKGSNGLWGFMNEMLELAIDYQFKQVGDFSFGYASFYENGKFGYINDRGVKVVPATYKKVSVVNQEGAIATLNYTEVILYDKNLKEVKKIKGIDTGVERNMKFVNGLCRLHLGTSADPKSNDEMIREYGGVQTIYINNKGEMVWKSKVWYSCFPGEALVTMADYSQQIISKIKRGDEVLSYNQQTKEYQTTVVNSIDVHEGSFAIIALKYTPSTPLVASLNDLLSFEKVKTLSATSNHPILTNQGVKSMSEIQTAQFIYCWNDQNDCFEEVLVRNKQQLPSVNRVYNLKTEATSYIVNGIVVMRK